MANEVRIDLALQGGDLKKTFRRILTETLNDKAIDKTIGDKVKAWGEEYFNGVEGIEKYLDTIQRLSDDALDIGEIEKSNAILGITANLLKQIEKEILNLGQMSFSDLVTGLATFVTNLREAKGLLSDFVGNQTEVGKASINYKALDAEGKHQISIIDQQIALYEKRQKFYKKYKEGTLSVRDLSEDQQGINSKSSVKDIQDYVQEAELRLDASAKKLEALPLTVEKNKLRDEEINAIIAGQSEDEINKIHAAYEAKLQEQKKLAEYQEQEEAKRIYAERVVVADNLLSKKGEPGAAMPEGWGDIVAQAKKTLSDIVEATGIEKEISDNLQELREQREANLAQTVAIGLTGAEELAPKTTTPSQEKSSKSKKAKDNSGKKDSENAPKEAKKEVVDALEEERKKAHEKINRRLDANEEELDRRVNKLSDSLQNDSPKIEVPKVIDDLSAETDEDKKRLQAIYDKIQDLKLLKDKTVKEYKEVWGDSWKNLEELNGETVDQAIVSKKLSDAVYSPRSATAGFPTGPESHYSRGNKVRLDSIEKYIDQLVFKGELESGINAGILDSVDAFRVNPAKAPTKISGDELRERTKVTITPLIEAVEAQIADALGLLPTQVVEDVAQTTIPQAASTVSSKPTPVPSTASKAPSASPTTPSVSIPDGNGGVTSPPNTVYINVVYKKTRDQLAAEMLQLLKQLQSLLDKTPLKFAFEDPNGAEGGTLPQIFKALSKNTSHTITIQVNKGSINNLASAYHQVQNLANVTRDTIKILDEADKEVLQTFGASLPTSTVAAFSDEQIDALIKKLSELFESEDGVNYFNTLNESIKKLTNGFNNLLQKFQDFNTQANAAKEQAQDVIEPRVDSDAADSLWVDVQNASHKLFQKSSHKDAIGNVSQYKLIDQQSDAYKKLSETLFELYERYKALGGVNTLSDVVEDEWYSLNDKIAAPGNADLNKLEQDYADRVVRQANGEDIVNQFKELLSILDRLTPKFTELLELYKTINRVADEGTLNSRWSEVQQNMLKIINPKGEIDYDKDGFDGLSAAFYESYRKYRDLGGTQDFNALRMYDTSSLKPNAYESFFKDYAKSEFFPTQTPLGGVNDFISRLGDGAKQASTNIELLEGKIRGLEDALQTSNSVSGFFGKLSESLQPAKEYFDALTEKVKSVETQQQNIKIDTDDLVKPYEDLTKTLEGVRESLNSILELYKAINGVASQEALAERWGDVSNAFNGRGKFLGNGLLNAGGNFNPNKNADLFFEAFARYQRAGGTKQISDLTRVGADSTTYKDRPITFLAASNLGWRYEEYRNQQFKSSQPAEQATEASAPTIDLTKIEGIISTIRQDISNALGEIKASIASLPSSLSESLKTETSNDQPNLSDAVVQAIGAATNVSIINLGRSITQNIAEQLNPLLAEALAQMRVTTMRLDTGDNGSLRNRRASGWFREFSRGDQPGRHRPVTSLSYAEGKYRSNPIVFDFGGEDLLSLLKINGTSNIQDRLDKNLSKQGVEELLRLAGVYNDLVVTRNALGEYDLQRMSDHPDWNIIRELDNEFEALHVGINNFLKDFNQGKYALSNSRGVLQNGKNFVGTPEEATAIIKRLIAPQNNNIPLRWLRANGGKFSGNFSKEGTWSGTGVDAAGNATKVVYAYDPFNKDIRTLQVNLPKETQKNQRAIAKQQKDFENLQADFFEGTDTEIAGTKVQNIGKDTFSDVLSVVTIKTDELASLRDQIYTALNQSGWDELNSRVALGVVSKTDPEYQRFQDLLDLLDRFKTKTKEVNSLIGSSNGEGWLRNNKGDVLSQDIANNPKDISQAIEDAKKLYDGLTGKLSASGQSFSGQYKDASNQIHDVTIAYNEATQSVRVFDQVNGKATEDLQKRAQEQYESVKKVLDETNQLSNQQYGGVNFGDLNSLKASNNNKPLITQATETQINEFQQAVSRYQSLFNEAAQNNTDWATVAQSQRLGNAEPFTKAYEKLKTLLSLSDDLKKLSETIGKVLAPDTGSGWLENDNGNLISLPSNANLSPQKASETIRNYLENTAGYSSVTGGKHDKQGWHFKGTKNAIEYPITVSYDSNGDLRYLQQELDKTGTKIAGLDNLGRQTFNSFRQAIVTLTPLVTVINSATQAFQNGYNTLVDYDKALTNISYTMTLSKQQLQDLGQATVDMAKNLNLSISDAMSVAQIYANMQTTPEEIVELSRPTAILANLSGQNTETAANYVQSVIEQFGMAEEDAMHIVDVYDTVSANIKMDYAKGIGVIASATEAAGQVAKDAGLSFEQLAAVTAKVAERTREEGSSIGNALKTIITRLSKASQLSGAEEVDNETLSKASAALADIGIQVYTSEGEFRSFGTIIGELADKWDSLTDVQQSNLSYQIAATRQVNKFKAIIMAYKDAMDLANDATEVGNTALANQEKYAESLSGKLTALKTEVETLWLSLYDSEEVGEMVDMGSAIVKSISDLISNGDGINIALGIGLATTLAKSVASVLPSVLASTPVMQSIGKGVASALGGTMEGAIAGTAGIGIASAGAVIAGALALAIWRGIEQNLKAKAENVSKAVEAADTAIAGADSIRDYTDLVKELRAKLADSNLTESERYNVKSQLYEIQNKLNDAYGTEASQLDLVNGKYEDQINKLDELSKKQIIEWKNGSQSTKGGFGQTVTTNNVTAAREAKQYLESEIGWSERRVGVQGVVLGNRKAADTAIRNAVVGRGGIGYKDNSLVFYDMTPEQVLEQIPSLKASLGNIRDRFDLDSANYNFTDKLLASLSSYEEELSSKVDQANQLAEMLTLSELFDDNDASNLYFNYKEAIENYKEALANGDNTSEAEAEFNKYQAEIDKDTDEWHQRIYQGLYDDFVNSSEGYREKLISNAFGTGGELNDQVKLIGGTSYNGERISDQDVGAMREKSSSFDTAFTDVEDFFKDLGYNDPTQAAIDHLVKVGAILGEIKEEAEDIFKYTLKKTEDTINKVDNIKTATDKIGSIFKDLEENETLSADNYATLYDTFGGETGLSDIDGWMQKISMAKGNVEETEKLINEMVAAWIELKNPAEDIAKADAEIINQSLKEIGATYKDLDATAQAKVNEAIKERYDGKETRALTEISEEETLALADEATQLGLTTEAEKLYYAQKVLAAFTLNTDGDVVALENLCATLGITTDYLIKYYRAKANLEQIASIQGSSSFEEKYSKTKAFYDANSDLKGGSEYWTMLGAKDTESVDAALNAAYNELSTIRDENQKLLEEKTNEAIGVEFKGTSNGSSGGGSGSTADPEAVEWQERRIKYLEKEHNLLTKIYEDEKELYSERRRAYSDAIGWDQQQIQAYTESKNNWKKLYEEGLAGVLGTTDTEGKNPITREMIEGIQSGMVEFNAGKYAKDDYDKIKEVLDYYDSFIEADEKILDLEEEISEHRTAIYESRIQEIEQVLTLQQTEASMLSTRQSMAETTGKLVTEDDYKKMIRNSKSQVSSYYDQIDVYEEYLEELEEGSEEYAEVENKIASCNNAILEAKAQQAEWNEEIKKIPITRLESYLSSLSRIKALMENMQNEVEATGNTLTADQMQTFISLDSEELEARAKQLAEYQKLINSYEWGSTKYEETESSMKEIESSISSIVTDMTEWNKQILNLPIDKLTEVNEQLSTSIEALTEQEEEYNTTIDAVTSSIDERIDVINKERDATEEYYNDQIEKIQDVVDALEEENELRDKRLAVEQAEYDLNKAMNQRNVAVIDDSGQTRYIADEDSVRQAQDELDEAKYAYKIYLLQQEIKKLEDERDELLEQYDDQIEALEEISEKWEKITSNIQLAKDSLIATNYLGKDWLDKVLTGNDQAIFDKFVVEYKENDDMLTAAQNMLDSNNRIITLLQAYVDDYIAGKVSYEEAFADIKSISGYITTGLGVTTNLEETLSYLRGEDFKNFLTTLSGAAQEEANKYGQYLSAVQKNSNYMEDYQVSLNDLSGTISENIKALKASYEAATNQTVATNTLSRTIAAAASISVQGEGVSTLGDAYVHHSGINTGYIGAVTSDEKLEALKAMTLSPLKPDEMPALLQAGEIVLNRSQQDTLLSNIKKLGANTVNPVIATATPKSGTVVNMTLSNLTFHEIQNGQDFANYITKNLSSAVAQATY